MRRAVRENSLSITMFGLFAIFLVAQSITGWRSYDSTLLEHHRQPVSSPESKPVAAPHDQTGS
jgi:hypothetical protein